MALATDIVKKLTRRVWTRFMDRFGGRLVSGMADTSADAPSAGYKPKRDLYRKMQEQRRAVVGDEAEGGTDHDHEH